MTISFNSLPANTRVPFVYVEFDNTRAVQGPSIQPYKVLVLTQRLTAGTIDALTPERVTSAAQAKTYFGAGSMAYQMAASYFQNNALTETTFVALDDLDAGQKATGDITVGGTVSAGTIRLYIGGRRLQIAVTASMTLAQIATAIAAAITADTDGTVAAEVDGSTAEQVNLTARHKGEAGNDIDIRHSYFDDESLPTGVTLTINAMSSGSGNPDISTVWPVISDEHFNIIICPWTDAANLSALETELTSRTGPLRMIDGLAFASKAGTHSELTTFGSGRNSEHVCILHAHGTPTTTWEIAAAIGGVVAQYGNIDPARPFQTLPLNGVKAPQQVDRFTLAENNLLLFDGISTFMVDAGGTVLVQRLITTYQTNGQDADDISYLDVNTLLTLSYLRYDFRNYILLKYPRHKLADDGKKYGAGQAIITPKVGKAEAIARFRIWEQIGLVENIDQFKNDLICERNASDPNRLDWLLPPDLVNQFRIGGVQIGFLL